jgi:peptidoglycan/LPS O-acetylase OafA/YrhL
MKSDGIGASELTHKRIYGLDIVRAFAILTVVYAHGVELLPAIFWSKLNFFVFDGVSVFFVLSGFLIGGILIRTLESEGASASTLKTFMFRRWTRTLPNYYLVMGALFIFSISKSESYPDIVEYFFFTQNFSSPHPGFFPEAWSLAVEEWFYLLLPLIVFALVITKYITTKQAVLIFLITIIIVATGARYYKSQISFAGTLLDWNGDSMIRKQVINRMDSIAFGLLGAYIHYYYQKYWIKWQTITFLFGICLFFFTRYSFYWLDSLGGNLGIYANVLSYTLISLGVLMILPQMSNIKVGKGFLFRFITFISFISYSMYLVNYIVVRWIAVPLTMENFPFPVAGWHKPYIGYILFWVYTIFIASLLYFLFEKPIMKWRDKKRKVHHASPKLLVG